MYLSQTLPENITCCRTCVNYAKYYNKVNFQFVITNCKVFSAQIALYNIAWRLEDHLFLWLGMQS